MQPFFLPPPGIDRKLANPRKVNYEKHPPKKRQGLPALSPQDKALFEQCREIRDRYEDGVPLSPKDRRIVLQALRKHPRGREKFGAGVQAVMVSTFVGGAEAVRARLWESSSVRAKSAVLDAGHRRAQFRASQFRR